MPLYNTLTLTTLPEVISTATTVNNVQLIKLSNNSKFTNKILCETDKRNQW